MKENFNAKTIPFTKMVEPFADIQQILDGTHIAKFSFHTLPVSSAEVDTFEGFQEYIKSSPIAMGRRMEDLERHYNSILMAIEWIEQDCLYARKVLELTKKSIRTDFIAAKYDPKLKRLRKKRDEKPDLNRDARHLSDV